MPSDIVQHKGRSRNKGGLVSGTTVAPLDTLPKRNRRDATVSGNYLSNRGYFPLCTCVVIVHALYMYIHVRTQCTLCHMYH